MRNLTITFILCSVNNLCLAQVTSSVQLADAAKLVGNGIISNDDFTFNATFTPDGKIVYFSRATVNFDYIAIFYSLNRGSSWSTAKAATFTGIYRDADPVISADGKRLYFSSDRPLPGRPFVDYDYHLYPSFAANGNLYFFRMDHGDADIYCCQYRDCKYLAPTRLSFNNDRYFDFDPVVASEESFIVFSSNSRKGFGGTDLWVSFKEGASWSEPVNMGNKVNTPGSDSAPGFSRDNKNLYFSAFQEKPNGRFIK